MIPLNPKPVAPRKAIYARLGQSNEVGHGSLSQLPDFPLAYRVSIYGYNDQWREGAEPVHDHTGITPANSVFFDDEDLASSGMAFANEMATEGLVGLVPCAKGGTSISQWQKGQPHYNRAVARVQEALEEEGTYLAGITFYQGEEDSRTSAANLWASRFMQFVLDIRSDLGNVPIVFCQLGPNPNLSTRPQWNTVKAQQASISMPNVYMVTTDDLQTNSDKVHMNTPSLVTIGLRQANIFKGL